MWLFQFGRNARNAFRLLAIILIIVKHSIKNAIFSGPLRKILDPKGRNLTSRSERLRLMIEDLGPTFIKFGQIIADRPDLASENLRMELKKLQSSARPFDDDEAISLIEKELGDPIGNIFSHIDGNHIASASISQVYRGTLLSGERVVIKIQRPGIKTIIQLDLVLLRIFAERVQRTYPELASFNIVGFIDDFGKILLKELDFTNEVANMMRFADIFKHDDRCYIPKLYTRYCTQKLLIMEHVEGYPPDDIDGLRAAGFDTQAIAENGVNVILTMILRYGFFHADPHPGNIFIRGNNQLVLIDHGMCATMKPKQIVALIDFLSGFASKNSHKITKALLRLTNVSYLKEQDDLEFEIDELIKKYSVMHYDQVDLSGLISDTFGVLIRYEIMIPSSMFMLLKTLATIQKLAERLEAKISIPAMIEPYAREKIMERFSWDSIKAKLINSREDYVYLVDKFPKDVKEIVTNFKRDGIRHRITIGEEGINNKHVKQQISKLSFVFLIGLLLMSSTLLMIFKSEDDFVHVLFYFTAIVGGVTAFRLWVKSTFI